MRYSMLMRRRALVSCWLVASILLSGCASQRIVPESMESLVDRTVSFRDLLVSPESYKGRLLVLGGERPSHDRQQSQGRFFAMQQEFLDPATMTQGTRVTIVGEVSGSKTDHLDDVEYRYPTLIVKHLHVWRVQPYGQRQPGFSIGGFGGMGIGGGTRGGGGLSIGF